LCTQGLRVWTREKNACTYVVLMEYCIEFKFNEFLTHWWADLPEQAIAQQMIPAKD
jgi:hypothetical protein